MKKEKSTYREILEDLNFTEDTLSTFENEVFKNGRDVSTIHSENFSEEEVQAHEIFQKLRESGLTYTEVNILAHLFENSNLRKILDEAGAVEELIKISPTNRLKQALSTSRKELNHLRNKVQKFQSTQEDVNKLKKIILQLESEVNLKQQLVDNFKNQLSKTHSLNEQLEARLNSYEKNKTILSEFYTGNTNEYYQSITEKNSKFPEIEKENKELSLELEQSKKESQELKEKLEFMENKVSEIEQEVQYNYEETIQNLKEEVEGLVSKKQKEWEEYYAYLNEQRRNEILTLQKRTDEMVLNYENKLKEKLEEIEELRAYKYPVLKLLRSASTWFKTTQ